MCTLRGLYDKVFSLAFSPDGKRVVGGSDNYLAIVIIWDVETGTQVCKHGGRIL